MAIEVSPANRFSIGAYPDIGLKEARDIARGARHDHYRAAPPAHTGDGPAHAHHHPRRPGFAEGRGWIERSVALSNIEELKIRHVVTSNPAIERPADLGRFFLHLDGCNDGSVATAMRLLVMLPVHPGELVQMRWEDVDWVGADWRYMVSKTKHLDKSKHIVPLPEQALVLLRELHRIRVVDEEGKGWVFVSPVYLPKDLTDI